MTQSRDKVLVRRIAHVATMAPGDGEIRFSDFGWPAGWSKDQVVAAVRNRWVGEKIVALDQSPVSRYTENAAFRLARKAQIDDAEMRILTAAIRIRRRDLRRLAEGDDAPHGPFHPWAWDRRDSLLTIDEARAQQGAYQTHTIARNQLLSVRRMEEELLLGAQRKMFAAAELLFEKSLANAVASSVSAGPILPRLENGLVPDLGVIPVTSVCHWTIKREPLDVCLSCWRIDLWFDYPVWTGSRWIYRCEVSFSVTAQGTSFFSDVPAGIDVPERLVRELKERAKKDAAESIKRAHAVLRRIDRAPKSYIDEVKLELEDALAATHPFDPADGPEVSKGNLKQTLKLLRIVDIIDDDPIRVILEKLQASLKLGPGSRAVLSVDAKMAATTLAAVLRQLWVRKIATHLGEAPRRDVSPLVPWEEAVEFATTRPDGVVGIDGVAWRRCAAKSGATMAYSYWRRGSRLVSVDITKGLDQDFGGITVSEEKRDVVIELAALRGDEARSLFELSLDILGARFSKGAAV